MRSKILLLSSLAALTLGAAGCDLDVADPNAVALERLSGSPAAADLRNAAQGLLIGSRDVYDWYVALGGHIGREGYYLDPVNPEFVTPLLTGPLDPGRFYVTFMYNPPYRNIRLANTLLAALDGADAFTDAQKEATRGFAKTVIALDYLNLISVFDESGLPIDVGGVAGEANPPVESRAAVYDHIVGLLDEGLAHLLQGGDAFPFSLTPGFDAFATPASFARFNRGLAARAEVYRGDGAAALAALSASFVDASGPLAAGAYHDYGTGSGDKRNPVFDPNRERIHAHGSLLAQAQLRPDGGPDLRAEAKVEAGEELVVLGIPVAYGFTIYDGPAAPIPILKNEDLILLRAEANILTGDFAAAAADLNLIRARAGGLAPIPDLAAQGMDALVDELLYNRRYSLLWEGVHRWVDMRRWDRLDELPKAAPSHRVWHRFPLPANECLPRDPQPAGCALPPSS